MTNTKQPKREHGNKWDGRSRISTSKYKKNYNEINWGNLDEIAKTMKEDYEVNKVDRLRKEGKL
mgnify:FL=1|tara:strand:- start:651 stop:842 length:192 start_codon:yes stop_codon:yes gene_type:complete